MMLGDVYRRVYGNCGFWCCRSHSGAKALYRHSLSRARAREKREWRRDQANNS